MASLTCTLPGLVSAVPGSLNNMSSKEKEVQLIHYLYRQANPSTVGQNINAASLLASAACLECGVSESRLQSFAVWIQRQAAIDAGASIGTFDPAAAKSITCGLNCLSMHQLRAIEIYLRCLIS